MDKTFSGKLNADRIKPIRDKWKGKLVLKGVASEQDTEDAIKMGFDGIIVSNHGGRQLDAAQSTIASLQEIAPKYGNQIEVMIDSGLRSGPDIARAMASGAKFTFMVDLLCMAPEPLATKEETTPLPCLRCNLSR